MDDYESLSHSKWDCKYHVVFIPKCRRKTLYGELRQHLGEIFRRLAMQKESRGRGRPPDAGSRSYDDIDPAEICGFAGDRVHQGQECYPPGTCLRRAEAQLHRAAFLGQGLLRLDRRSRRSGDQGIHQEAGGRRLSPRSTEHVALRPPSGGPKHRGSRQRPQRPL